MTSRTSARRKCREQYEKVLRIVEYQSGGKQPALARRSSIISRLKIPKHEADHLLANMEPEDDGV